MNNDTQAMKTVYFAINRKTNRAEILHGSIFNCWEMVQSAFYVGILMSDGNPANGIGRCKSIADFCRKANHGGTTILVPEENPFTLEIEINGVKNEVASDIWRSWTGLRWLNGNEVYGERFNYLSNKVATPPLAAVSQTWSPCSVCGESPVNCDCDPVCSKTHKSW